MGWNDDVIDEFRSNGGRVDSKGFGGSLILVHHRGARTGIERIAPLLAVTEPGGWMIIASKGGAPTHPDWYHNLLAHPDVEIEVPAEGGVRTVPVHVDEVGDADYEAEFAKFVAKSSAFPRYAERAGRRMPILRLTPR